LYRDQFITEATQGSLVSHVSVASLVFQSVEGVLDSKQAIRERRFAENQFGHSPAHFHWQSGVPRRAAYRVDDRFRGNAERVPRL